MRALPGAMLLALPATAHAAFELRDERGSVAVSGRVQAGYAHTFLPEGEDDRSDDGFLLEAARISLEGELWQSVEGELSLDLVDRDGLPEAKDAWLGWHHGGIVALRVGQFKAPVSRCRLAPDGETLFAERPSVASDFVPGRDLGAMASLATPGGLVRLHAGLFNGRGDNAEGEDALGRPLQALRLEAMPWGEVDNSEGAVAHEGGFAMGFGADMALSRDSGPIYQADGDVVEGHSIAGRKLLVGGDLTLKAGRLFLNGELHVARFDPEVGPRSWAGGFLAQASYYIAPIRLEPALRFDSFNPNDLAYDDRESTLAAGLNVYPLHDHRVRGQLVYRHHLPPSSRYAEAGSLDGQGWTEDDVSLLVQLWFR